MNVSGKIDKLLKLHLEIGQYFAQVKNFNVCVNGVFLPADSTPRFDVVFAGLNPSTTAKRLKTHDVLGNWNVSKTDFLFQEYLRKFNLTGVYVTDFSHFGRKDSKANKITDKELVYVSHFFQKEIEILQPKIVACFGDRSFALVSEAIKDDAIQILKFWHPAAATRGHGVEQLKEKWEEQFQRPIYLLNE